MSVYGTVYGHIKFNKPEELNEAAAALVEFGMAEGQGPAEDIEFVDELGEPVSQGNSVADDDRTLAYPGVAMRNIGSTITPFIEGAEEANLLFVSTDGRYVIESITLKDGEIERTDVLREAIIAHSTDVRVDLELLDSQDSHGETRIHMLNELVDEAGDELGKKYMLERLPVSTRPSM